MAKPVARHVSLGLIVTVLLSISASFFVFLPQEARAAVIVWDGGGTDGTCGGAVGDGNKWSCAANWVGDVAPGAADIATFNGTSVKDAKTTNIAPNVLGVDIQAGYTGTINAIVGLTAGASGFSQADGTYLGGATGNSVNGNLTISGGSYNLTSNSLILGGSFIHTAGGTFNHNNGQIWFSGATVATVDVATTETFGSFRFGKTGALNIASGDTIIATGTTTFVSGSLNTGTIEAQGPVTLGASSGTAVLHVTGALVRNVAFTGNQFCGLWLDATNTTLRLTKTMQFWGPVTVSNGLLDASTSTGYVRFNREFTQTGGTFTTTANETQVYVGYEHTGGTFNHSNGTLVFYGRNSSWLKGNNTFYNVQYVNISDATKYVEIESGSTQVILNRAEFDSWYVSDATSHAFATLKSTVPGSPATITFPALTELGLLKFQDIVNNSGTDVLCSVNCINLGGNSGIDFSGSSQVRVTNVFGNTTEAGATQSFTVVLTGRPEADVTIDVSSSDVTEGTVLPATLTFTSVNWDTPQTVTITGADDADNDGPVLYDIVLDPAASTDGFFNGKDPFDQTLWNFDNDASASSVEFDLEGDAAIEDVKDSTGTAITHFLPDGSGFGTLQTADGGSDVHIIGSKIRPGCSIDIDGKDYQIVDTFDETTMWYNVQLMRDALRPNFELDIELDAGPGVVNSITCSEISDAGAQLGDGFTVIDSFPIYSRDSITYDPVNNRIWVPSETVATNIDVIDVATGAIATYTTGSWAIAAAYDSTRDAMWVLNGNNVTVFNAATGAYFNGTYAASTFAIGSTSPQRILYDAVNDRIWIATWSGRAVQMNAATGAVVVTHSDASYALGIAYDSVRDLVWINDDGLYPMVAKFNAATGSYANGTRNASRYAEPALSGYDSDLQYDASQDVLWMSDDYWDEYGSLLKIRPSDGVTLEAYPAGGSPNDFMIDNANRRIWIANPWDSTITVLDQDTGRELGMYPIDWPEDVIVDNNGEPWVAADNSETIKHAIVDGAPPDDYYTLTSNASSEIDTSSSGGITGATVTETLNGQDIFYSVSFDDRNSFKVWGSWRTIASNKTADHGGVDGSWYWRDNADAWTAAVPNTAQAAISAAVEAGANNQMTGAEMEALLQADWEAAGGFDPGVTPSLNLAATFHTDDERDNPSVEKVDFALLAGGAPPALSFTNDVEAGPVRVDAVVANWDIATIMLWDYDDDAICSVNPGDYSYDDGDSMDQNDEMNNGWYICLYGDDGLGNTSQLASSNDINIDITPPAIAFADEVEAGPVLSDIITPFWDDATVMLWDYDGDGVCSTDPLDYLYDNLDSMDQADESKNGWWICMYAEDALGNDIQLASGNDVNIDLTPPAISFTDDVEAGPVLSDTITPFWDDATVMLWDYDGDGVCSADPLDYTNDDGDSMNQTNEMNNGAWICMYAEDALGNDAQLASANDINVDLSPPALSFADNVEAGPVGADIITPFWDDATVMLWDYDDDDVCSADPLDYTYDDGDSMDQADESNNGWWICLYGEDALGNDAQLASANDINIDITAPAVVFTDNVAAGPVPSDTVTADWGDATVKLWDYDDDGVCSADPLDYSYDDTDSMNQTDETNNGLWICLYAEDAVGNDAQISSSNDIFIDLLETEIIDADTADTDLDGTVDQLTIEFNETVAIVDGDVWNGLDSLELTDGCTIPNGNYEDAGTTTLVLAGLTGCPADDTGITPTVSYSEVADCAAAWSICDDSLPVQMADDESEVADDSASPVLLSVSPADGATDVPQSTDITWNFSEPMATGWLAGAEWALSEDGIDWTPAWSDADRTVTVARDHNIACNTLYEVTTEAAQVEAVSGEAGFLLFDPAGPEDGDWTFETYHCRGSGGSPAVFSYSIDLTNPDGGNHWQGGATYRLEWTSGGTGIINQVNLAYSTDGGASYVEIVRNTANRGYYDWTVPDVTTGEAIVRIEGTDLVNVLASDKSAAVFSIIGTEPAPEEEAETPEEEGEEPAGAGTGELTGCDGIVQAETDEAFGVARNDDGLLTEPLSGTYGLSPVTGAVELLYLVRPGDLVRSYSFSTVYCITKEYDRRPFMDETSYFTDFSSFDRVKWVSDATLSVYPVEKPMMPDPTATLGKFESSPTVYRMERNPDDPYRLTLRALDSEMVAIESYGENWADYVIDLNPTLSSYFEYGAPVMVTEFQDTSGFRKRELLNETSKNTLSVNTGLLSTAASAIMYVIQGMLKLF